MEGKRKGRRETREARRRRKGAGGAGDGIRRCRVGEEGLGGIASGWEAGRDEGESGGEGW